MSEDASEWRWADADGAQKAVDEWDLVAQLSSGQLPAYTLVWRRGWTEWLPATAVGELASALPAGMAEAPHEPHLDALATEPPPPPLEHYKTVQTREAAAALLRASTAPGVGPQPSPVASASSTAPPRPPRAGVMARGAAATLMGKPGAPPPPPPQIPRPPMPTLVDEPRMHPSVTLRPPGAIPPPPRGIPTTPMAVIVEPVDPHESSHAIATPIPAPVSARAPEAELSRKASGTSEPAAEVERIEVPPTVPPALVAGRGWAPPAAPAKTPWANVALAGIAAVLAVLVVVLLVVRSPETKTRVADDVGGVAPVVAEQDVARGCTLASRPKRLSSAIVMGIAPHVAPMPDGKRLAVGIAASPTSALGLAVNPSSLDVATVFRQGGQVPILGVVPTTARGQLEFIVDRADMPLRFARTVDAARRFTLGVTDKGLSRVVGGGAPEVVWPEVGGDKVTEPRVARVEGHGFAVTFRRGGQSGSVLVGWLGPDGSKKSELEQLEASRLLGTPVVAANDRATLLAFAGRSSPDAYWNIELATAEHGNLPKRPRPFPTPPGGPGSGAISPAAAGLPGGRWLLQWTEGSSGQHQVRVQMLDADLVAIGDPVNVSSDDANAGQGVVWAFGESAVSLFLVSKGRTSELWGATLTCLK